MSLWFWRPVVPSWEKKIHSKVDLFAWIKFLKAEECTESSQSIHVKTFDWDDSGGKEAFHNTENRFYAQKNGLSFPNPVPNPNMYIDEIDWDAKADLELEYSRSISNANEDGDDDDGKAKGTRLVSHMY